MLKLKKFKKNKVLKDFQEKNYKTIFRLKIYPFLFKN